MKTNIFFAARVIAIGLMALLMSACGAPAAPAPHHRPNSKMLTRPREGRQRLPGTGHPPHRPHPPRLAKPNPPSLGSSFALPT